MKSPPSDMTPVSQKRFVELCQKLLEVHGNSLYNVRVPRIAAIETPDGAYFIKDTREAFCVYKPSPIRTGGDMVYCLGKANNEVSHWDPDRAEMLMPYIMKKFPLDLLADL